MRVAVSVGGYVQRVVGRMLFKPVSTSGRICVCLLLSLQELGGDELFLCPSLWVLVLLNVCAWLWHVSVWVWSFPKFISAIRNRWRTRKLTGSIINGGKRSRPPSTSSNDTTSVTLLTRKGGPSNKSELKRLAECVSTLLPTKRNFPFRSLKEMCCTTRGRLASQGGRKVPTLSDQKQGDRSIMHQTKESKEKHKLKPNRELNFTKMLRTVDLQKSCLEDNQ